MCVSIQVCLWLLEFKIGEIASHNAIILWSQCGDGYKGQYGRVQVMVSCKVLRFFVWHSEFLGFCYIELIGWMQAGSRPPYKECVRHVVGGSVWQLKRGGKSSKKSVSGGNYAEVSGGGGAWKFPGLCMDLRGGGGWCCRGIRVLGFWGLWVFIFCRRKGRMKASFDVTCSFTFLVLHLGVEKEAVNMRGEKHKFVIK